MPFKESTESGHCVCSEECFCSGLAFLGGYFDVECILVALLSSSFSRGEGKLCVAVKKSLCTVFSLDAFVISSHTHTHMPSISTSLFQHVHTRIYTLLTSSYSLPVLSLFSLSLSLARSLALINTLLIYYRLLSLFNIAAHMP